MTRLAEQVFEGEVEREDFIDTVAEGTYSTIIDAVMEAGDRPSIFDEEVK